MRHTYSHFRGVYLPFLAVVEGAAPPSGEEDPPGGGRWVTVEEARELPLPVAQQVVLKLVTRALETP